MRKPTPSKEILAQRLSPHIVSIQVESLDAQVKVQKECSSFGNLYLHPNEITLFVRPTYNVEEVVRYINSL